MEIKMIDINKIHTNPLQPRESFDREKLKELADSIKTGGLLQPPAVRPDKGDTFEIVYGERRIKACQINKLQKIPCLVLDIKDDTETLEKGLIENWHRDDLTSSEREKAVSEIWNSGKYKTHRQLAEKLGISESVLNSTLAAINIRKEIKVGDNVSTRTIVDTTGLEKEHRENILKKVEKGEIEPSKVREKANILKKVPKSVAQSVLEDKIDWDQAETVATTIEKDKTPSQTEEIQLQKHLEAEKRMLDIERTLSKKTTELEVKGKPEKHPVFTKTNDERTLEYFKKLTDTFKFMTKADINIIEDDKLRTKAIDHIKEIRENCSRILRDLGEDEIIEVE